MPLGMVTNTPNVNMIKEWPLEDGKVTVSNHEGKIYASITKHGISTTIPIHHISGLPTGSHIDIRTWEAFFSDTWVRLSSLGEGEYKLYINPRLNGGGNITIDPSKLWPRGIVPYEIDIKKYPIGDKKRQIILEAIGEWNNAKTGFQFVPRTNQNDVLVFGEDKNACYSNVGYQGGAQYIRCHLHGGGFNKASIVHEIGHAIGFYHEHQRDDRDNFVEIMPGGRDDDYAKKDKVHMFGRYDLGSIMHYYFHTSPSDDSKIKPKLELPEGAIEKVGRRETLSEGDIAAAREMYRLSRQQPVERAIPSSSRRGESYSISSSQTVKLSRRPERDTLMQKAAFYFNNEMYKQALVYYQALIDEYGTTFKQDELINLHNMCGMCCFHETGDDQSAILACLDVLKNAANEMD